ncbi:prenylcysteine oxidase-like isoform X2 [Odontomachus brunneus]|nr:prenylcysteine oxidase-like isoform X2 [Odontomachus brunneus]XP_032672866.1 prenylcysteine oxidase-like isoform X2 [Odontomachus brunneus]XP_032672867.1 prenylcysteine oxidase-like isoform X2 [Odontomachus brunneus]XP_032672868.1 prenylcysteine oxidase-like isoform X2 [Odontomachus brunneus]XP_032672869.1 prenylcysteine oxidase-like isoform X2 [Odontomachus brunneus]XP_032672870.1 prenylcysteine oxidase-like isoform X2 [Odontomachus brunneus]XP_032672872.1 prenylcysteine oxidase-like isof
MNGNLEIDLYEARHVGGRLATVTIGNNTYEAGGSIIHPRNMYMQKFVKLLGLDHVTSDEEKIGIWNGDEFVFKDSGCTIVSFIQLFYRYGFQVFKLKRDVNDVITNFEKIYELQDAGKYFANITALISAVNEEFPKWLQIPMKDHLLHMGYTDRLIDELAEAIVVVNYGQDTDIQSFVGLVSLAAVGSELWAVKGGNKEVPENLIYRNKNVNVVRSRVTKIRYTADNSDSQQYEVTHMNEDNTDPMTAKYDIVIIAAPLTSDQEFPIEFVNFPEGLEFPGRYQTTHATFVKADIKPEYFGLQKSLDSIFSCNPTKTIISSVSRMVSGSNKDSSPVWKLFSRKPLEMKLIHEMFSNVTEMRTFVWKAYPHYLSNTLHNSFKLHDALYHVNAIEWIASAMEMSAISGRNVAILAYNDFLQKHGLMQHKEIPKDIPKTRLDEL